MNRETIPGALADRVRLDTRIPLWGILTVLGAMGVQAVALYYSQQRQVEELARQGARQTEIATDVRAVASKINENAIKNVELQFSIASLAQRVQAIESQRSAAPR